MAIYLDNAATTKPKFFAKDYSYNWMNSNTNYAKAEKQDLNDARKRIMDCLKVKTGKVLFCRCATEAVEWLIHSFPCMNYIGCCSNVEHDSVYDLLYTHNNFNEYIVKKYKYDYYLHQYVNQLTGTIYDIESIGKQVQGTGAYFGSDFTAAIGHALIPDNLNTFCDAVWFSGHKFGAEKGIGAIWISDRLFKLFGGNEDSKNEYGLIHGTVNVASAIAMSWAMKDACNNVKENNDNYNKLMWHFCGEMVKNHMNFKFADKLTNLDFTLAINSIVLPDINADALQNYLTSKEIYVGVGASACAEEKNYRALEAYGLSENEAESTIRISFCEDNTIEEIEKLVNAIVKFKEIFYD